MTGAGKKVLVVDDEPSICEGIDSILTRAGYQVSTAFSGEDALAIAEHEEFDVILMDLIMPGMDGAETCALLKRRSPATRIVAISGSPSGERMERFVRNGGVKVFLFKPFGKEELLTGVAKALEY